MWSFRNELKDCDLNELDHLSKARALTIFFYNDFFYKYKSKLDVEKLIEYAESDSGELTQNIRKALTSTKINYSILIAKLIVYHDIIIQTEGWQEKLSAIGQGSTSYNIYGEQGINIYHVGFPKHNCYHFAQLEAFIGNTRSYSDMSSNMETWFYSFWHRRYKEGSFNVVYKVLKALE